MSKIKCCFLAFALFLFSGYGLAADMSFDPIPDTEKSLYRFDLQKWFYSDEMARQRDVNDLARIKKEITALKSEVANDPERLLKAIELKQQMGIIADRLQAYGGLRYEVNTQDTAVNSEGEEAYSDFNANTKFVEAAVQGLDDTTLKGFKARNSGLLRYEFLLQNWRRDRSHTVPEGGEVVLNRLDSRLDPFANEYYNLMINRTPDAFVVTGAGTLNVTTRGDYAELLHVKDRDVRESAFRKRLEAFKAQQDLYAFALYQKAKTANAVSVIRDFPDAVDAALFPYDLNPETLDAVLKEFRDHSSLAIRFQKAERAYQQKLLTLKRAEPWDLDARSADMPEPRFAIRDASRAVTDALKIFGSDYAAELSQLLDPRNGRLDIVVGKNRNSGDSTWGAYGSSWLVYMQGYRGYVADVVTLAHESAHAVHHRLLYKAEVPWYYHDGPRYFTEGFAKVNELLILDHLSKTASNEADRLFYLRELTGKLASVNYMSMYWAAYATSFETEVYRSVKSEKVNKPDDIHEIWAEYGRLWMVDFDKFPDLKYTWANTHHFFDAPGYYKYLFAWVLAISVYERLQADPSYADKFVNVMKAGFTDEPANLLRTHLDFDLADRKSLKRIFLLVEKQVAEFEQQVQGYVK